MVHEKIIASIPRWTIYFICTFLVSFSFSNVTIWLFALRLNRKKVFNFFIIFTIQILDIILNLFVVMMKWDEKKQKQTNKTHFGWNIYKWDANDRMFYLWEKKMYSPIFYRLHSNLEMNKINRGFCFECHPFLCKNTFSFTSHQ